MLFETGQLAIVALSALLGVAAVKYWRLRMAQRPACLWLQDLNASCTLTAWECQTCGEQAFGENGDPPGECKKALRVMM
ncbi:MAG: hypothetical protein V3U96_01835 [Paracoccaceae bacterium]